MQVSRQNKIYQIVNRLMRELNKSKILLKKIRINPSPHILSLEDLSLLCISFGCPLFVQLCFFFNNLNDMPGKVK